MRKSLQLSGVSFARVIAVAMLMALNAAGLIGCAHAIESDAASPSSKEPRDMTSSDRHRVSQPDEHPDLSADEVGRRVLKLLGTLHSFEGVTAQNLAEQLRIPLKHAPAGKVHAFTVQLPDSGWYYSLTFAPEGKGKKALLAYEFQNPTRETADISPVCGLDFLHYESALKAAGFAVGADYDEIGQLLEHLFRRDDLMVRIVTRSGSDANVGVVPRTCVERLTAYDVD